MPNGDVHNTFTISLCVITAPIAFVVTDVNTAALYTAGVIAGIFITPDLDQSEIHSVKPQQMVGNLLGEWVEYIYRIIWYPYGLLIAHRDWRSHAPIIGTLIRVGYLYCIYWLVCWNLRITPPEVNIPVPLIVGLCLADTQHFILDQLPFFRGEPKVNKKALR